MKQIKVEIDQTLQSTPQLMCTLQSTRFNSPDQENHPTKKNLSIHPKPADHSSVCYEPGFTKISRQRVSSPHDMIKPAARDADFGTRGFNRKPRSAGSPVFRHLDNCRNKIPVSGLSDSFPVTADEWVPGFSEDFRKRPAIRKPADKGGHPIEISMRGNLEPKLGFDMADVRVHHQDEMADQVRKANAEAITHGNHIYFASGMYNPYTRKGRALLVHELTHVLQHKIIGDRGSRITHRQLQLFEHQAQKNEQAAHQNHDFFPVTSRSPALNISPGSQPACADAYIQPRMIDDFSFIGKLTPGNKAPIQAAKTDRNLSETISGDSERTDASTNFLESGEMGPTLWEETYQMLTLKLQLEKERMGS